MLANQTRVTHHLDAPFYMNVYGSIIEDSGVIVSPVLPPAQPHVSSHRATGKMGTRSPPSHTRRKCTAGSPRCLSTCDDKCCNRTKIVQGGGSHTAPGYQPLTRGLTAGT